MPDRRALAYLIAIGGFAVLTGGLAVALIGWSSELQVQVYTFYSENPQAVDESLYRYWDSVGQNAYALQSMAMPLFLAALGAIFALLAVLTRLQERPAATP